MLSLSLYFAIFADFRFSFLMPAAFIDADDFLLLMLSLPRFLFIRFSLLPFISFMPLMPCYMPYAPMFRYTLSTILFSCCHYFRWCWCHSLIDFHYIMPFIIITLSPWWRCWCHWCCFTPFSCFAWLRHADAVFWLFAAYMILLMMLILLWYWWCCFSMTLRHYWYYCPALDWLFLSLFAIDADVAAFELRFWFRCHADAYAGCHLFIITIISLIFFIYADAIIAWWCRWLRHLMLIIIFWLLFFMLPSYCHIDIFDDDCFHLCAYARRCHFDAAALITLRLIFWLRFRCHYFICRFRHFLIDYFAFIFIAWCFRFLSLFFFLRCHLRCQLLLSPLRCWCFGFSLMMRRHWLFSLTWCALLRLLMLRAMMPFIRAVYMPFSDAIFLWLFHFHDWCCRRCCQLAYAMLFAFFLSISLRATLRFRAMIRVFACAAFDFYAMLFFHFHALIIFDAAFLSFSPPCTPLFFFHINMFARYLYLLHYAYIICLRGSLPMIDIFAAFLRFHCFSPCRRFLLYYLLIVSFSLLIDFLYFHAFALISLIDLFHFSIIADFRLRWFSFAICLFLIDAMPPLFISDDFLLRLIIYADTPCWCIAMFWQQWCFHYATAFFAYATLLPDAATISRHYLMLRQSAALMPPYLRFRHGCLLSVSRCCDTLLIFITRCRHALLMTFDAAAPCWRRCAATLYICRRCHIHIRCQRCFSWCRRHLILYYYYFHYIVTLYCFISFILLLWAFIYIIFMLYFRWFLWFSPPLLFLDDYLPFSLIAFHDADAFLLPDIISCFSLLFSCHAAAFRFDGFRYHMPAMLSLLIYLYARCCLRCLRHICWLHCRFRCRRLPIISLRLIFFAADHWLFLSSFFSKIADFLPMPPISRRLSIIFFFAAISPLRISLFAAFAFMAIFYAFFFHMSLPLPYHLNTSTKYCIIFYAFFLMMLMMPLLIDYFWCWLMLRLRHALQLRRWCFHYFIILLMTFSLIICRHMPCWYAIISFAATHRRWFTLFIAAAVISFDALLMLPLYDIIIFAITLLMLSLLISARCRLIFTPHWLRRHYVSTLDYALISLRFLLRHWCASFSLIDFFLSEDNGIIQ